MRIIAIALLGAALAVAGCSKPEQDKVQANANEAAPAATMAPAGVASEVRA